MQLQVNIPLIYNQIKLLFLFFIIDENQLDLGSKNALRKVALSEKMDKNDNKIMLFFYFTSLNLTPFFTWLADLNHVSWR